MADVAQLCGVSLSTVSLALNQKPGIPHETRLRVLEAAKHLGYEIKKSVKVDGDNANGTNLKTLGVFVKSQIDDPIPPTSNLFYSHVLAGIEESCRLHNLYFLLSVVRVDYASFPLEIPKLLIDPALDAALFVGVCINELADTALKQINVPTVLVDAHSYLRAFDGVVADNFVAGYQATNYLLEQGHRHIAFLGGFEHSHPSFVDRRKGYLQALNGAGVEQNYIIDCSYNNPLAVAESLVSIRKEAPQISAVLACNDKVAIELIQAAGKYSVRIPDELSIFGFDNITMADKVNPTLSTMDIDKVSMGRLAVELALFRSRFPDAAITKSSLYPNLLIRQSVKSL